MLLETLLGSNKDDSSLLFNKYHLGFNPKLPGNLGTGTGTGQGWGRVRVRGHHFLKNGTWVHRGYCVYIYVIVTSYMHIDFFINYES